MPSTRNTQIGAFALAATLLAATAAGADSGYEATGSASWYGEAHHGKKTASGERFNMNAMTAAHRKLPLGTMIEVTNLDNDKTVLLRVNDRGPYAHGRLLDVSREAAEQLGFISRGTARVQIRAAGKADAAPKAKRDLRPALEIEDTVESDADVAAPVDAAPVLDAAAASAQAIAEDMASETAPPAKGGYLIQVGAFSRLENAERAAEALAGRGQVTIKPLVLRGLTLHRVLLGSWPDTGSAKAVLPTLATAGFKDAEVVSAF